MKPRFPRVSGLVLAALLAASLAPGAEEPSNSGFRERMTEIEHKAGGRLGVAALDTGTGRRLEFRAGERFALCSTFKLLLVSAVLSRVDAHRETLDRLVAYGERELEDYAPIARKHLPEGGLTISELCAAVIEYSDNTAANLLLRVIGGPDGLTRYVRSLGDPVTRLDRDEPSLNSNLPGDERDTTSPAAMLGAMTKLLTGEVLSSVSRQQLETWLVDSKVGATRLRAGLNPAWRVGNRTGSGEHGATNDVAIVWPLHGSPFLVAVYYTDSTSPAAVRDSVVAEVGAAVSTAFGRR